MHFATYISAKVQTLLISTFISHCHRFKATLWMCEEFPLSLMEQVTPIIDLMARASAHFARLKDFITLEFPPGFPVKIGTVQQFFAFRLSSFPFASISVLQLQHNSLKTWTKIKT